MISCSAMESCNLCEHKYDKLFKTGEKLLGTQLGNVIKLLLADHQVEIPPKFLICIECSLALIQAEIVLKRLSNALSCTRTSQDNQLKAQSNVEPEGQKSKNLYKSTKEGQNEIVCDLDKYLIDLKFNCTYCKFTTTKPKLYKKHLKTKHGEDNPRIYQCPHCTVTYQRANAIRNHISFVHDNKPRPKRQRRKTIAVDTPALLSSTSLHNDVDNDASEANKTCDGNQGNGGNLPYEFDCAHCKYKTVHSKWFKKHLQVKHQVEDARIYKCKQCPSTYSKVQKWNINNISYV
ncbi:PR domain zinc finger protein 5-like [Anastrepha ludens]|uniref:PR domain zinc finger protein 5-like n=1 Tax=Anastrepha ludens TaxID=28586 RepID=UPI0023B104A1|nr:PR domain zinc finger protein 5-like [Anastrepha ludens]